MLHTFAGTLDRKAKARRWLAWWMHLRERKRWQKSKVTIESATSISNYNSVHSMPTQGWPSLRLRYEILLYHHLAWSDQPQSSLAKTIASQLMWRIDRATKLRNWPTIPHWAPGLEQFGNDWHLLHLLLQHIPRWFCLASNSCASNELAAFTTEGRVIATIATAILMS